MRENRQLTKAKSAKNDEFYTQYNDIQKEVNAYLEYDPDTFRGKTVLLPCDDPEWSKFTRFFAENFERLGLKKLISTSYAAASKKIFPATKNTKDTKREGRASSHPSWYQPSLFELQSPQFDEKKTAVRGKIFVLDHDTNANGRIDLDDLEWRYLEGDGDFRSEEVCRLRDEADVIVTNPPFSLFREFLAWILGTDGKGGLTQSSREAEGAEDALATKNTKTTKQFLIIGNINCITYKEVFPRIMRNEVWLGNGMGRWISGFIVPPSYELYGTEAGIDEDGNRIVATNNCLWLTNIDHGRRHQPLQLMTMADNVRYSKHKDVHGIGYREYDNYDAIEVPHTDSIPLDYDGVMGVPITYLDKYCPDQFEIVGASESEGVGFSNGLWKSDSGIAQPVVRGEKVYKRLFIRARRAR